MHNQAEHQGTRYDCNVCFKQFKRKGSLGRHMNGVHGQGENKHKCNLCTKEFKQKSHLKTHMKNIHQLGGAPARAGVQQGPPSGDRPTQVPPPSVIRSVGQPLQQGNVRVGNGQHTMMQHNGHAGFAHM
jgi:hypothetical protein